MRIQLEPKPLIRQRAIVSRGTSCFLSGMADSGDWDYVTKFSWTSDRRESEAHLLQRANKKGVRGLARLVGHCDITRISEMRSEMTLKRPYTFRSTPNVSPSQSVHPLYPAVSSNKPSWTSSVSTSGRSGNHKSTLNTLSLSDLGLKVIPRVLETRSHSKCKKHKELVCLLPVGPYDNRIFRCLVIFPAGRPIYNINTNRRWTGGGTARCDQSTSVSLS